MKPLLQTIIAVKRSPQRLVVHFESRDRRRLQERFLALLGMTIQAAVISERSEGS